VSYLGTLCWYQCGEGPERPLRLNEKACRGLSFVFCLRPTCISVKCQLLSLALWLWFRQHSLPSRVYLQSCFTLNRADLSFNKRAIL
jgi:hypothetical protein